MRNLEEGLDSRGNLNLVADGWVRWGEGRLCPTLAHSALKWLSMNSVELLPCPLQFFFASVEHTHFIFDKSFKNLLCNSYSLWGNSGCPGWSWEFWKSRAGFPRSSGVHGRVRGTWVVNPEAVLLKAAAKGGMDAMVALPSKRCHWSCGCWEGTMSLAWMASLVSGMLCRGQPAVKR